MLKTVKKIQEWGNSLGIRLSREELRKERIEANEKVEVFVRKKTNPARELFGSLKVKEPTSKIMKEIDKEFKSRFD